MRSTASRLARNSFFLYTRMIILMGLSLYTSRVVLKALGVDDFGIYSVVGSITTMFLSLRSVFSEAIQRFLNYEKGCGDVEAESEVFSLGVWMHVLVAVVFCALIGTLGTLYLNHTADIPEARMGAARLVFISTIFSSVFVILLVPYDAVVIANEKMDVYAWVSIADGVFRLASALSLVFISVDSLVLYAILTALIPVLNFIFYLFYCSRFPECKYKKVHSREKIKSIVSFAGWSFGGNMSYTLTHEGINLILNSFGGVVANAARSIAYQVRSAVNQVSNNTILATKPFIVQSSVSMSDDTIWEKILIISRLSFYIMVLTALPIIVYCDYLLSVWLTTVPDNSVQFTRLIIVATVIRSLHGPLDLFYMAKGKIKRMVLVESTILLLLLPAVYGVLALGYSINVVFILLSVWEIAIVLALTINASREFGVSIMAYVQRVITPSCLSVLCAVIIGYAFIKFFRFTSIVPVLVAMAAMVILFGGLLYWVLLRSEEKTIVKGLVQSFLHR